MGRRKTRRRRTFCFSFSVRVRVSSLKVHVELCCDVGRACSFLFFSLPQKDSGKDFSNNTAQPQRLALLILIVTIGFHCFLYSTAYSIQHTAYIIHHTSYNYSITTVLSWIYVNSLTAVATNICLPALPTVEPVDAPRCCGRPHVSCCFRSLVTPVPFWAWTWAVST